MTHIIGIEKSSVVNGKQILSISTYYNNVSRTRKSMWRFSHIMYLEQEKVCEVFNTFTWRKKNVDEDQDIALNLAWI